MALGIGRTGLFVQTEKRPLFLSVFENILIQSYNIIPYFGPTNESNLCEIRFVEANNKDISVKTGTFGLKGGFTKAEVFLKEHFHLLDKMVSKKARKKSRNSKSIQVIDLVGESSAKKPRMIKMIDLTKMEPDVILLDETIDNLNNTFPQLDITLNSASSVIGGGSTARLTRSSSKGDDVQLIGINNSLSALPSTRTHSKSKSAKKSAVRKSLRLPRSNSKGSDIQILCTHIKSGSPSRCLNSSDVFNSATNLRKKGVKQKPQKRLKKERKSLLRNSTDNSVTRSVTKKAGQRKPDLLHIPQDVAKKATKEKKSRAKKLQDVSNLPASRTLPCGHLSDDVLKYYANLDKTIAALKKSEKKSSVRNSCAKKLRSLSPLRHANNVHKLNATRGADQQRCMQRNNMASSNLSAPYDTALPSSRKKKNWQRPRSHSRPKREPFRENNIFNPNPYEVDKEGLRPVVIDGCNLAFGHGKGKFSVKGVKICVDYFAIRGHDHVKVFLPQTYKKWFTDSLLEELEAKCDVVFTPSLFVNGVQKTPYDDRFIVQYADEMGGVIVSTDNYRDLLKENPRWTNTIQNRLLMFTWVDDLLMFPVDPMGKNGPSLDQLLKY